MTDTLVGVNPPSAEPEEPAPEPQRELSAEEIAVIEGLARKARAEGAADHRLGVLPAIRCGRELRRPYRPYPYK